jgi:hypothetical protein
MFIGTWIQHVNKGGDWDATSTIRTTYGAQVKGHPLYFNAGGRTDIADRLFGNIIFGYLGRGAGWAPIQLELQSKTIESAGDFEGISKADQDAIAFGEQLWDKYPNGISEDKLSQEIETFIQTNYVHTRASQQNCRENTYTVNGAVHRDSSCDGEPPPAYAE